MSKCDGKSETSNGSKSGSGSNSNSDKGGSDPVTDAIMKFIDQYTPTLQKLGFGGIMGVCTGVAMKRIGNGVATMVGIAFIALQGLNYAGYININYGKVTDDAKALMDADGDGKLTADDAKLLWARVKEALTYNLPSAGGFSAGFALGVYYGN